MKTLQYVGTSHYREISGEDLEKIGLDGTRPIQVARHDLALFQNNKEWDYTVELTNETADWLMAYEKGEWVEVDPGEIPSLADRMVGAARTDQPSVLPIGEHGEDGDPLEHDDAGDDS